MPTKRISRNSQKKILMKLYHKPYLIWTIKNIYKFSYFVTDLETNNIFKKSDFVYEFVKMYELKNYLHDFQYVQLSVIKKI